MIQMTYKGEQFKAGIFESMIDYTFIHPDYTEEMGTIQAKGTGTTMVLEVVSKNDLVLPKYVLQPFKFHTIYKNPENEHTYNVEVDVAGKKIIVTHKMDETELTKLRFLIQGSLFNLKMIQMKGKVQATRWFMAGPVESTFLVKGNDYEFNINYDNKEIMKSKINIQNNLLKAKMNFDFLEEYKGTVYVDFDTATKLFEVKFPKEWFADMESFGIAINFKALNDAHPFLGGD